MKIAIESPTRMKILLGFMALLCVWMACGCSKYWYQEGKSFGECKHARGECYDKLMRRSDLSGLAVEYKVKYMEACMQEKGYRLLSQRELPIDVIREEPPSTFYWRANGIAGELREQ